MLNRTLLVALLACAVCRALPADDTVRIDSGLVRGTETAGVRVYRGIPYAAPPVGDLRWRPPRPPLPWEGVRICDRFGPACPQPAQILGRDAGRQDEDCLYLNVWTGWRTGSPKLPVMVWIHGGSFTTGAGSMPIYDGAALAGQGVVLVTINYRLGPFGFFAHPLLSAESERNVSGNYGLLDQIAALEWVRRNAAAFGGDPGCVTIFGESAGAAAVSRLMVSPLAEGLFHRAIAQSGGPVGHNRHLRRSSTRQESMEEMGLRLEKALGCDTALDRLAALRAVPPARLLDVAQPAQGLFGKGNRFGPVVDGWVLPEDPQRLWSEGRQADVPFMTGVNADEGMVFLRQLSISTEEQYRASLRAFFGPHADQVLARYPAQSRDEITSALDRIVTVNAFVLPARLMVRAMADKPSNAYLYYFTRPAQGPLARGLGAFHGLEIGYVFGTLGGVQGRSPIDRRLSEAMSAAWVRFARTGDPNGGGLPRWEPYDVKGESYVEFGETIRSGRRLRADECGLFERMRRFEAIE